MLRQEGGEEKRNAGANAEPDQDVGSIGDFGGTVGIAARSRTPHPALESRPKISGHPARVHI
jgi:hypothetical protein